jgi:protein-tyrosine phosphatase
MIVFSWITDMLAVGGRFEDAEALARDHGIAAVIDLREEDRDDEHVLRRHGIALLHLPTPDMLGVSLRMLDDGVAFANRYLDAGKRVLVHCQHGIGRSAMLALSVLVSRGMSPLEALALAKDRRGVVSPSPEQFEAWTVWLRAHGYPVPTFAAFATIAYRHLREAGVGNAR